MTAAAKLDSCLVSATISSACPAAATITAHGTHTGKGPTSRIVGVVSSRPKHTTKIAPPDSTTPTPLSPRHAHRRSPHSRIVGVTAAAKLNSYLVSVSTDGTRPSAYPPSATTTAQGTHTDRGPTRGIVGVIWSRPK